MSDKPISEKKIEANRKNARKSTGPKTPEGKAKSSQNALTHGLLAQQILVNDDDPNEPTVFFDILFNGLTGELQPQGFQEILLVERIAVCYWRIRRAYRYEAQSIRNQRQDELSPFQDLARSVTGREADPYKISLPSDQKIQNLVRYETMIDRQLNRCLTQLYQLQSSRPSEPQALARGESPHQHPVSLGDLGVLAVKQIAPNEATVHGPSTRCQT